MGPQVVVVGSVNEDLVMRVPRLPRPGETVLGGTATRGLGGKGANAAVAAARLGARVWLVGAVGRDEAGVRARAALAAAGVDVTGLMSSADSPTGTAQVLVDDAGENAIAVAAGANATVSAALVEAALGDLLEPGAVVLANHEIPEDGVRAAAEATAAAGAVFVLDPAPARPLGSELLQLTAAVTPNEHELPLLMPEGATARGGRSDPAEELLAAGARAVVVTRGAEGADLYRPDHERHHQRALPATVVDTTGAGDAFTAALGWALASRRPIEDALRYAAAAGACATEATGAQAALPDLAAVERRLALAAGR